NEFYARSVGTTGGGMQLSAGVFGSNQIANAFKLPANTSVNPTALGAHVTITNDRGVVQLLKSPGATVNLTSSTNSATLTLNHGVMVFQSSGNGADLQLDGGTFRTDALRPIAFYSNAPSFPTDEFINAVEDTTIERSNLQITARKGALLSITTHD